MLNRQIILTALLIFALPAGGPAFGGDTASTTPSTMLIIDGSGSMWGRIDPDKRAKIDIVRETLVPLIAGAGQTRIGLASYGHRRRGDCSDVEIVTPPVAERDGVLAVVSKLNPKGKGPIAEALRQTAKVLGTARPASILIVTDGADNCQQDACEAAADLARTAPGVPVHVVSLAVEPDETPRLSCVAKATGGRYFDVRDAPAIAPALEEAAKLAMLAPGPAPAAPGAAPVSPPSAQEVSPGGGPALRLTASLAPGSPILALPIHWRVTKPSGETVREGDGPDLSFTPEPGTYDVEASLEFAHARQTVTVEPRRLTAVTVPLNAARLKLRARAAKDAEAGATALISVAPDQAGKVPSGTIWLSHDGQGDVILPPGNYSVTASDGLARKQKVVALTAGTDSDTDLGLATGTLEVSAAAKEEGPPFEAVTFAIAEDDPDSPDGRREIARANAAVAEFTLAPGTYYVTAYTGLNESRQRIAVRAGERVKRTLVVPVTRLKVSSIIGGRQGGDGAGLQYRVTSLEGDGKEVARTVGPTLDLNLKAGRYKVEAKLGTLNVKAAQDVTLEPGKPTDLVLKLEAGEIGFKPPAGTTAGAGDVYWEIRDQAGRPVWHTTLAEPNAVLAPGRYTVRLESRDRRTDAAFELKSGERKSVQLGAN